MAVDEIEFIEEGHIYRSKITGDRYISSTTIVHEYCVKMDRKFWLAYKTFQLMLSEPDFVMYIKKPLQNENGSIRNDKDYLRSMLMSQTQSFREQFNIEFHKLDNTWKVENKKSTDKGSLYHLDREIEDSQKVIVYGDKPGIKAPYTDHYDFDLTKLTYGYRKEFLVYSKEALFCGRMDRCWIYRNKTFDIGDWKTNKELKMSNKFQKMLGPLSHLDDCLYNHYRMQLSIYAKLLSLWGYKPRYLSLTHIEIKENGTEKRTPLFFKYLEDEANIVYNNRLADVKRSQKN